MNSVARKHGSRLVLTALVAVGLAASTASAQDYGRPARPGPGRQNAYVAQTPNRPAGQQQQQAPQYQVAERSTTAADTRALLIQRRPNEHPLMPCLRWAYDGIGDIERIHDYSATLVKRERIKGKLGEHQYMFVKVRHNPFSVYLYFLAPDKLKGQEVIYVDGQNNNKIFAHGTGIQKIFGTVSLDPTGPIAMQGNRYPITETGVLNLVRRLIEIGEKDSKYGECEVKFYPGAKIEDRLCTCIQVVHPVPRRNFLFNVARIYVDDALNVPIRYEAYDWPAKEGGPPRLTEEYTYLNLKLNNGFTDADFDVNNPNYQFTAKK